MTLFYWTTPPHNKIRKRCSHPSSVHFSHYLLCVACKWSNQEKKNWAHRYYPKFNLWLNPSLRSATCRTEVGILIVKLEDDENNLPTGGQTRFPRGNDTRHDTGWVDEWTDLFRNQRLVSGFLKWLSPGAAGGGGGVEVWGWGGVGLKENQDQLNNHRIYSAHNPNLSHRFWVSSGFLKTSQAAPPAPPRSSLLLNRTAMTFRSLWRGADGGQNICWRFYCCWKENKNDWKLPKLWPGSSENGNICTKNLDKC